MVGGSFGKGKQSVIATKKGLGESPDPPKFAPPKGVKILG